MHHIHAYSSPKLKDLLEQQPLGLNASLPWKEEGTFNSAQDLDFCFFTPLLPSVCSKRKATSAEGSGHVDACKGTPGCNGVNEDVKCLAMRTKLTCGVAGKNPVAQI